MQPDSGNALVYMTWSEGDGWGPRLTCNNEKTWGCPALYTLNKLSNPVAYCVFAANNEKRDLILLEFHDGSVGWTRATAPYAYSAYGVKGTSWNRDAYISFQKNNEKSALVSTYARGWGDGVDTGESSADTPTVCAHQGVLNCFFNSNNYKKDLLWVQTPLEDQRWQDETAVKEDAGKNIVENRAEGDESGKEDVEKEAEEEEAGEDDVEKEAEEEEAGEESLEKEDEEVPNSEEE